MFVYQDHQDDLIQMGSAPLKTRLSFASKSARLDN